jgi:cytochrome c oxidase assembly protein subunit 15
LRCLLSPIQSLPAVLALAVSFGESVPASINTKVASLHRFAVICAGATFVLIFIGGLVTSTGSALAVPDWPLAFGKLIPPLEGGIRFEWGHRVVAGFVSILTLILAVWTWWRESRRWLRLTALAALGLVVLQAVLGGLTVLMLLPLALAVAHAATAQAFFCLMIAMVLFTDPGFGAAIKETEVDSRARRPPLTSLATVTTIAIYMQILIGAVMRHLGAGLAIPDFPTAFGRLVPPFYSFAVEINFAHRCGAVVVISLIVWTFIRVMRSYSAEPQIRNAALLMIVLVPLQVTLGVLTIWSGRSVLPTTAHVAIGAALLGASVAITIRAYELKWRTKPVRSAIHAPVSAVQRQVPA